MHHLLTLNISHKKNLFDNIHLNLLLLLSPFNNRLSKKFILRLTIISKLVHPSTTRRDIYLFPLYKYSCLI